LKDYRQRNKPKHNEYQRVWAKQVKVEGVKAYGGKCSCCGEDDLRFLTLEHLAGHFVEGKHLKSSKGWSQAKKLGWPKDLFTVLCFNCNCAKGIYGVCPHQIKE
jgi:hypothetical protein